MSDRGLEFKVGLTVVTAIVLAIVAIVWLKEMSLTQKKRTYVVTFPSTGGLAASDQVQVNGMRKGQVKDMELAGDHVVVRLDLAHDVVVTRPSVVAIRDVGLMGEKVIAIDLKDGPAYDVRDTIPGVYEQGLAEVMGQLGTSVNSVSEIAENLKSLTGSLAQGGSLQLTLEDFRATSHELRGLVADNRVTLTHAMSDLAASASTAKSLTVDKQAQVRSAIDHFASTAARMDSLSSRLDSLRQSMQGVATRLNNGDGTLGKLVGDDKLYDEMHRSITTLNSLIEDVKKNPKKYVKFSIF
jgi:phospholipid/cholesterol/gamma-HCH transport system substrate-binding protein